MATSFLIVCWLVSLLLLIGIFGYARTREVMSISADVPENFRDFIAIELARIGEYFLHGFAQARPHGERVIAGSTILLKKGHDLFIEKIIGRIEVEKGKTASFFLKRIVEYKESLRGEKDKTIVE